VIPPVGSYARFCDDFLVVAAECHRASKRLIDVEEICRKNFPDIPDNWKVEVIGTLVGFGLGQDRSTLKNRIFEISGSGILTAERILETRRKVTLAERFRSVPRSDWIAFGALVVSFIALFKS
jgi:hypothetical protein